MGQPRRRSQVVMLAAVVTVLLPAGVLAASVVDPRPSTSLSVEGRAGVAAIAASALLEDPVASATAPVTAVQPPPAAAPATPATSTSTKPPTPTTATTIKAATTTVPPGASPIDPNHFAIPNIAPAGAWQSKANGVSARMRIDPAVPTAGQPVRFLIEVSSAGACCVVMLDFGDGSEGFGVNKERLCSDPSPFSPGPHSSVTTHTYAGPGAYKATLSVLSGDICALPAITPGSQPPIPWINGAPINACIAVGPGAAGHVGCSPNSK